MVKASESPLTVLCYHVATCIDASSNSCFYDNNNRKILNTNKKSEGDCDSSGKQQGWDDNT